MPGLFYLLEKSQLSKAVKEGDDHFYFILIILCIAGYTDIRERRIPDSLVITIAITGIAYHLFNGTAALALSGFLAGAIMIIPFAFNLLGAGDAKLFMALDIIMGPVVLVLMLATLFCVSFAFLWGFIRYRKTEFSLPMAPYILLAYLFLGGVSIAGTVV